MSKKNNRKYKKGIASYILANGSCLDFERPIIIDGSLTDYSVTRDGDIISYKYYNTDKPRRLIHMKIKGYHAVNLIINGKERMFKVYRLVAEAFIPNPDNKPEVNHLDGDKDNNSVENLEWVTPKENIQHAFATMLTSGRQGESHPMHKITEDTAIQICSLIESNMYTMREISIITGSTYSIVKKIKNRTRWTHISKKYNFSNFNQYEKIRRKVKGRCLNDKK